MVKPFLRGLNQSLAQMFMLKARLCGEELFTLTLLAKNNEGYKKHHITAFKAYQRGYVDLPLY